MIIAHSIDQRRVSDFRHSFPFRQTMNFESNIKSRRSSVSVMPKKIIRKSLTQDRRISYHEVNYLHKEETSIGEMEKWVMKFVKEVDEVDRFYQDTFNDTLAKFLSYQTKYLMKVKRE